MAYPTGIHRIDGATYHADLLRHEPTLASTLARVILNRSPLHAWTAHPRLNPAYESTERKTFDIGRAAHRAVLGAGGDYAAYPPELLASNGAASTKEAKAWADEMRAGGITPLKADDVDMIGDMAAAVGAKLRRMGIALDPTRSELTALAEVDGVWCRAMLDNAPLDPRLPLYDLKSTEDASPDGCIKSITGYGYDLQAAFYLAAWKAATGEDRKFRFIFVEKAPPYGVGVVELHNHWSAVASKRVKQDDEASLAADWMANADANCRIARETWGECLRSGVWPEYPDKVATLGAPGFYSRKAEDRVTNFHSQKPSAAALAAAGAMQAP